MATYRGYMGKDTDLLKAIASGAKETASYSTKRKEEEDAIAERKADSDRAEKNKPKPDKGFDLSSVIAGLGGFTKDAIDSVVNTGVKTANTAAYIPQAITQIIKENNGLTDEEIRKGRKDLEDTLGRSFVSRDTAAGRANAAEFATDFAQAGSEVAQYVAPFGTVGKGASLAGKVLGQGTVNAGAGGLDEVLAQLEDKKDIGKLDFGRVAQSAALGGVLGAGGSLLETGVSKALRRGDKTVDAGATPQKQLGAGTEAPKPSEGPKLLSEPGARYHAKELEDIQSRLDKVNSGDINYLDENGLTRQKKDDARFADEVLQNPETKKAHDEATQAVVETEDQIKQYTDMKLSSPYHRQVDQVEAKAAQDIEQLQRVAEDQGAHPDDVKQLTDEITANADAEKQRLAEKYPEDAAEAPALDDALKNATAAHLDAQSRLQEAANQNYQTIKESGGLLKEPDAEKLLAHKQQLEARQNEITTQISAAAERAAAPAKVASDVDKEIDDLISGTHPLRQGSDNKAVTKKWAELNNKKAELEGQRVATTPPKSTRQTPEERSAVLPDALDSIEVPNNRKNLGMDVFEMPNEFLRYRGLNKIADKVDDATMNYRRANFDDLSQVGEWKREAKGNSTQELFRAANGDKEAYAKLTPGGAEAVDKWKAFAQKAAQDLGLPKDGRITDYIPHLFVKGGRNNVPKLIDVDSKIAQAIDKIDNGGLTGKDLNIAKGQLNRLQQKRADLLDTNNTVLQQFVKDKGNVRNQFLERRMGAEGYNEDFWKAVQLYTMQKNRKIHVEPATQSLVEIADKTAKTDMSRWLVDYADQLRGGKSGLDSWMDDKFSEAIGGKNIPTRALRKYRDISSLSKLGFNAGSVVNSSMQLINLAPVLGGRAATEGMVGATALLSKVAKNQLTGQQTELFQKMLRDGVFEGSAHIVPDKSFNKYVNNFNEAAFAGIKGADRLMRISAYIGAQSKGQRMGLKGQDLDRYAYRMSNKVNQNFDSMVVPKAFRSQVAKSLGSMVSFAPGQLIRSGEVLASGAKGVGRLASGKSISQKTIQQDADEIAKVLYLAAGGYVMSSLVGQVTGNGEAVPNPFTKDFWSTPATDFLMGTETKAGVLGLLPGSNDKEGYTDENGDAVKGDHQKRVDQFFGEILPTFTIPGYAQYKKTTEGNKASEKGYSETATGNIRFATDPANNLQRSIFGQWSTPEAKDYLKNMNKPNGGALSSSYSEKIKEAPAGSEAQYMKFYMNASKVTGRQKANEEVTRLFQEGQPEAARRKAREFNDKVSEVMAPYFADYRSEDPELEDELNDRLKIVLTARGEKQRAK